MPAAAEDTHNLSKFCEWWKKHCNMESLTMSGLPKGVAGQKGGVAKCSRRGQFQLESMFVLPV